MRKIVSVSAYPLTRLKFSPSNEISLPHTLFISVQILIFSIQSCSRSASHKHHHIKFQFFLEGKGKINPNFPFPRFLTFPSAFEKCLPNKLVDFISYINKYRTLLFLPCIMMMMTVLMTVKMRTIMLFQYLITFLNIFISFSLEKVRQRVEQWKQICPVVMDIGSILRAPFGDQILIQRVITSSRIMLLFARRQLLLHCRQKMKLEIGEFVWSSGRNSIKLIWVINWIYYGY